jgi:regulator of protease activity HflC (stomatin/prohibitin superfamily)
MSGIIILIIVIGLAIPFFIKTIKQGEEALIITLGKYSSTIGPGIVFLIPGIQSILRVDLREQVINVPEQQIITKDNVGVAVDGIVYVQIMDSYKSQYAITNVFMGVVNLAQTSLRSVLGTMSLDETLSNREVINARLLETLDRETEKW